MMFKKLVAVEPVNLTRKAQKELEQYAEKVLFYEDIPKNEEEIIKIPPPPGHVLPAHRKE